jgi:hypothetical protein
MKSYVPVLSLNPPDSPLQGSVDKFGGLPAGFPQDRWPSCAECGTAMTFVAQFSHHPKRFPLGKDGRVLYLFQCESGSCSAWEPDSGANCVLILEKEELAGSDATAAPQDIPVLNEAWVEKWVEKEERMEMDSGPAETRLWLDFATSPVASEDALTKLGGHPDWLQMPEPVEPPYCFAAQIDHILLLTDEPELVHYRVLENEDFRSVEISGSAMEEGEPEESVQAIEFARFGDGGRGYLFVNPDPDHPEGYFLWQSW